MTNYGLGRQALIDTIGEMESELYGDIDIIEVKKTLNSFGAVQLLMRYGEVYQEYYGGK